VNNSDQLTPLPCKGLKAFAVR